MSLFKVQTWQWNMTPVTIFELLSTDKSTPHCVPLTDILYILLVSRLL